jgi:hypothetical protein
MTAYEELERQLLQSVASRSWARNGPVASFARWWRASIGQGGAIATLVLVLVLGTAVLTGIDHEGRSGSASSSQRVLALDSRCGPCRTFSGQLHGSMAGAKPESRGGGLLARERRGPSVVVWSRSVTRA